MQMSPVNDAADIFKKMVNVNKLSPIKTTKKKHYLGFKKKWINIKKNVLKYF